jgi:hypothetical protein
LLGSHPRSEEVVVVGDYQFCTMFNEVTHILDTQLRTYRDPVETVAPPRLEFIPDPNVRSAVPVVKGTGYEGAGERRMPRPRRPSPEPHQNEPHQNEPPQNDALQVSDTEIDTDPGYDPTERATDWELAIVPAPPSLVLPVDPEDLVGILMIVEANGGQIRLVHALRRRDRLDRLLNQAALDPAPGVEPAWPRRIRVVDPDLARALHGAETSVVVVDSLPTLQGLAEKGLLVPDLTGQDADEGDEDDDLTNDEEMPELIDADHRLLVDASGEAPSLTFQLRKRDAEQVARRLEDLSSLLVVGEPSGGVHVVGCSRAGEAPIALLTFIEQSAFASSLASHVEAPGAEVRVRVADGGVSRAKPPSHFLLDVVLPASAASAQ